MNSTLPRLLACALAFATAPLGLVAADSGASRPTVAPADVIPPDIPPQVTTEITFRTQTWLSDGEIPPLTVNVAPFTRVKLVLGVDPTALQTVVWYKNGKVLPVSANYLEFSPVSGTDAGQYTVVFNPASRTELRFNQLLLRVEAPGRQRLLNLSTRVTINPSQRSVITGFVVAAAAGNLTEQKLLLIRAVGPTLGNYGVPDPLADPELHLLRQDGTEVTSPIVINVYPGPYDGVPARVGAFPLPPGSKDFSSVYFVPAGVYSARVSSASGGSGTVLLEIYEVPQ